MSKYLIMIALSVTMLSCSSSRVYEEFAELPQGWAVADRQHFIVPTAEWEEEYSLTTQFRVSLSYPYSNLYYELSVISRSKDTLYQALEEAIFFDQKSGKPLGSGIGDLFHIEHSIRPSIAIEETDTVNIVLTQYMRVDTLVGLDRIGVRINRLVD
ncbi:MAG: gliding motility-associated lipoprotein GldH [Cyclobacteriaceae bacterium]|jgi:gliding motility-associated lipoprotein GldH